MKAKKLLFLSLLSFGTLGMQASASGDTVKVISNPGKVVITESGGKVQVNVSGTKDDPDYRYNYRFQKDRDGRVTTSQREGHAVDFKLPFSKTDTTEDARLSHWECFTSGLYFGFGNSSLKNGGDIKMNHLSEFGLLNLVGIGYKPVPNTRISLGVGFGKRNYFIKSPYFFGTPEGNDRLTGIGTFPDDIAKDISNISSSVGVVQMHVPLMFCQRIRNCSFSLAAIMNWNMHADLNVRYKTSNERHHVNMDGIRQRPVTVDFMLGFGWKAVGLYTRYQPMSVFRDNYGPEIKDAWSVGMMIGF